MINIDLINEESLLASANYLNNLQTKKFIPSKLRGIILTQGEGYNLSYDLDEENIESFLVNRDRDFCRNNWILRLININVDSIIFDNRILRYQVFINDDSTIDIRRLNYKTLSSEKVEKYERLLIQETKNYLAKVINAENGRDERVESDCYIERCYIVDEYFKATQPTVDSPNVNLESSFYIVDDYMVDEFII